MPKQNINSIRAYIKVSTLFTMTAKPMHVPGYGRLSVSNVTKSWRHTESVDFQLSTSLASVADPWIGPNACVRYTSRQLELTIDYLCVAVCI